MVNNKVYDCITFFDENLLTNLRFEILNDVVDYFIVCESHFDHKGNKKKINFKLLNKKFENKVRHIIIEENFPNIENGWEVESYQREKILDGLYDSVENDISDTIQSDLNKYIFFDDLLINLEVANNNGWSTIWISPDYNNSYKHPYVDRAFPTLKDALDELNF